MGVGWSRKAKAIATLWGFCEASFFFIVPDVWLSILAKNRLKPALWGCMFSLAGALLGGLSIYLISLNHLEQLLMLMSHIPAINPEMILQVNSSLAEKGVSATLFGPLRGTPYKLYAAQAASNGIGLMSFLLTSIPARLTRFVLVSLLTHYGFKLLIKWRSDINKTKVLLSCWLVFYGYYFWVMGCNHLLN